MTEKRLIVDEDYNLVDTVTGEWLDDTQVFDLANKLAEENKELQERNNRQAKRLDDIYQLIEQKDWRALSDIMDDFKKAEEQLQSEWQTYGDVE